ncbi:IS4/Tn5 family transposase DNA-binding protein [Noviherbaspirillum soli]|uniref:IS4/Tn5 family transposase DNA-binding protein n=1 Tax=Noviherbaspirillum soli TaxID=1064518 RepID=UPI00188C8B96|nr:transposase [Noviherbaspirillum soli]
MSQDWAAQELAGIDLGAARLNKRSITLLDRLADKPTASNPHACNGSVETQLAYRFLAQEDIGWEDILASSTTELDFNGQQTEGLGTLSFPAQRGMYLHQAYAVSPEREPLGVLDAWMWVQDASKMGSRSLPAGAKESCRLLERYARLAEQVSLLLETRLVYVTDRESDFLDWMVQASALGTPVDWLIRSAHNRKLVGQQEKLWGGFA